MSEAATKIAFKTPSPVAQSAAPKSWHPFEALRQEIDRLMDDFDGHNWMAPFRRGAFSPEASWRRGNYFGSSIPAVDVVDKGNAFEIIAELPGLDEKNIEVSFANGLLTIKGEKQAEKEEKAKDYYLHERHFGAFERSFRTPDGVDTTRIEAVFKNGVLTVTLPKTAEAKQAAKKITVKAA